MPRGSSWSRTRLAAAVGLLAAWATPALGASLPPRFHFKTLQSGRIKVHFHAEVEGPARRTMALALEILPRLEERYRVRVPSLDILVEDSKDSPNGLATSFPYPYVEIRTAAPDGAESGPTESWLRLVVTHELTHIAHIEQARGIYGFGRKLFGRAPFLFPEAFQPTWFIEGLAVREETRATAFGRGRHTYTRMLVDEAARDGQLEKMDQATLGLDIWPFGTAAYLFGEEFLSWLESEYGPDSTRDITVAHSSSLPYLDERTFRRVTGRSLTTLWREFARERALSLGPPTPVVTDPPRPLPTRGFIQSSPRLSPDRTLLAYTSRTLDGLGEIRLVDPDGSSDRRLTWRLSGGAVSWSPDGRFIVFDETNQVRKFETRSDLHQVEVATGHRTRLTTGLRASEPDQSPLVNPAGSNIVFVQRFSDRSELSLLSEEKAPRVLTRSPAGTEWSHPRFSPGGDVVAAARMEGGFLDLVIVDVSTGAVTALTHDRAVDAEPSWVDPQTLIFRSDREANVFRLFLLDRDGSGLRRVGNSPDHAFTPEVDPQAGSIFYARYSSRGYALSRMLYAEGDPVGAFDDLLPPLTEEPPPFAGDALPYRPWSALWPKFVTPYVETEAEEWRVGLATASFDPLLRTAYGLAGSWGTRVSRANALGYFRYDRFTPTLTALAKVQYSPSGEGIRKLAEGRLSVDFPLERSILRSQFLDLTVRRRRETIGPSNLDTGVLAFSWNLDSTRTYPMSISPEGGARLRVAVTREFKALGSDLDFGKIIVDGRAYLRAGKTVLASRAGAGWTFGPRASSTAFGVGGLSSSALLDPVGDQPAVLRGYEAPDGRDESRYGRRIAFGNLEWRVPIAHPQRGVRALPFFLRHLYATASVDAAVVSLTSLNLSSARVGGSLGLGADLLIGHRIPISIQAGFAKGLTRDGRARPWFSLGFPF